MKFIISIVYTFLSLVSASQTAYETNLKYIDTVKHNSSSLWELDVNKFVKLSDNDFSAKFKGYSMTYDPPRVSPLPTDPKIPTSFDWRKHGNVVGPVKNQEQCGSCWAFSAVGALESQVTKVTGSPVVLSEQEMVDCVKNVLSPDKSSECCYGCMGGEMYAVYQYLLDNKSEDDTEKQYPYQAVDQNCKVLPSTVKTKLKNYVALPVDEESIKTALYKQGPISVGVNANQDWQLYSKGIYNPSVQECDPSPYSMDHGVIIVGYGSEKGQKYWIVRNSWGADWGEQGYIRLARGTNACGVANAAIYPVLEKSVESDPQVLTGNYCGSIMGLIKDIKISFNSNFTFNVNAKVFGRTLSCSNEHYSYNPTTQEVTLIGTKDCLKSKLQHYGIKNIGITYNKKVLKLTVYGRSFNINSCSDMTLDACHDNCGNSCSSGPCGSCKNLCCGCGCDTCKCCHHQDANLRLPY